MEPNEAFNNGLNNDNRGDTWYVDNYILLKDYYDRTISRIAARCVRQGNIAMEEYPFYGYILDVLEEITETGDYIMAHQSLYSYVEKKIPGGINTLRKNLNEFRTELKNNVSPDMLKQDKDELEKMKAALGAVDKSVDPTVGAGMSMDEVVEKLIQKQAGTPAPAPKPHNQAPEQAARPQGTVRPTQPSNQPQNQGQRPAQPQGAKPAQSPFNNGNK